MGRKLLFLKNLLLILGTFSGICFLGATSLQAAVSYEGYLYVELDGKNDGGAYKLLKDVVVDVWSTRNWSCTLADDRSDGCGGDGSCTQDSWRVASHYCCSGGGSNPCQIACSPKPTLCTDEERHGTPLKCAYYKQVNGGSWPKDIA